MANATIALEKLNEKTFPAFKELVLQQAEHHSAAYTGDDKKFIDAINKENPIAQILLVRDDETQQPLAYILFNHYYGLKGQELYMEDLLVSSKVRSGGYGLALMEELKAIGRELGVNSIAWTVAENNAHAIRFYENKVQSAQLGYTIYDCSELYTKPQTAPAGYEVRVIDAADLDLLESYIGRAPGLSKEKVENIRAAANAANTGAYIVTGTDGTPKAVGITNANYSSFRTVFGYKLEMMELTDNVKDAAGAFKALTVHVTGVGNKTGFDGHLNICIDKKSPSQLDFIKAIGFTQLQMTDDAASVMLLYGLGRDKIYAPSPQNVVNSSQNTPPKPQQ